MIHKPVLQKEVLEYLGAVSNKNFIDCTIDGGGHATGLLKINGPEGKVLGIEIDKSLCDKLKVETKENFDGRLILINDSFENLKEIVAKNNFGPVHGILFDLGMSSWHLEESGRGFSFQTDEPLDMRYDRKNYLTAEKIVNEYPESDIEKILREYGEEKFAPRIAKEISWARKANPIKTTFQLVKAIKRAVPARFRRQKIHFATRTFQALRIAVNDELCRLKNSLPKAIEVLSPAGRIAAISFHSLEDRIVKNFFRDLSRKGVVNIITKKPITASPKELSLNPRSRSAKMRVAEKNKI